MIIKVLTQKGLQEKFKFLKTDKYLLDFKNILKEMKIIIKLQQKLRYKELQEGIKYTQFRVTFDEKKYEKFLIDNNIGVSGWTYKSIKWDTLHTVF